MIERPHYLDRLLRLRSTGFAKVLTGMRRTGKSGILRLLEQRLREEGVGTAHLICLNLELAQNAQLRQAERLAAYIREHAAPDGITYILIDEAQEVPGIAHLLYELIESRRFDVYLTGSHAKLIESELADIMGGRYVEVPIFPLSFAEYHAVHLQAAHGSSIARIFNDYLTTGGLPRALELEGDAYALQEYLDGVYHTVVRRDVAATLGHEDPHLVDSISGHLVEHIGMPTSSNGISQTLSSSGRSCSDDTVSRYLTALTDAYAFYRMRRLDLKAGTVLKTQERYFASDLGLCTLFRGPRQTRLEGLLQNAVYLELRRRYARIYAAKHYNRHIDFVADGTDGRAYFQVKASVLDAKTLEQTIAPLQAERDNYPKTILTLDEIGVGSHNGIMQRNLIEWLLDS
ncbi:MAG: ATP-binding protein [Atopobiaceae bacterium]|nr:ATP-binding protein [Atopobiaceae bacterium]